MNYKWYVFSILGLLLIGTGLCIFGEALIRKIKQETYTLRVQRQMLFTGNENSIWSYTVILKSLGQK